MIIITTQCFFPKIGGIESLMTGMASAMSLKKEVIVLADGKKNISDKKTKYKIIRFNNWKPFRRIQKARYLEKLCKENKVQAIYADSWKSIELTSNIKSKIYVLAHGTEIPKIYFNNKNNFRKKYKKERIIGAFKKSSKIIANSNYTKDLLIESLNTNPNQIEIVHPGIDVYQDFITSKDKYRISYIIGKKNPVLITLARLEKRKGHIFVLRAVAKLLKKYPNILYIIAGDGPYKKELKELSIKLNILNNVIFLGWITEPEKSLLLKKSDVFIMTPTIDQESVEGFGMSFIDAAFHGVPTIGTDSGGVSDAIINEKTGLICKTENQLDIEDKLEELLSNENYRSELGNNAKAIAHKNYTWSNKISEYLSIIE